MNRHSPVLSAQGIKKWIMIFEEKFSAPQSSQTKKGWSAHRKTARSSGLLYNRGHNVLHRVMQLQ